MPEASPEGYRPPSPTTETPRRPEVAGRFKKAIDTLISLSIGKVEVTGREHLQDLTPDKPTIFVVDHTHDLAVPLAAKVGLDADLPVTITHISGQRDIKQDPLTWVGLQAAGQENFIPIDVSKNEQGQWQPDAFNPENVRPMVDALQQGKIVVIAAHNPTRDHQLPERGGYAAVYAAAKAGARIVPMAVDLKTQDTKAGMAGFMGGFRTLLRRPTAQVTIGEPFELEEIAGLDTLEQRIHVSHEARQQMTADEQTKLQSDITTQRQHRIQAMSQLREHSSRVMRAIATLLPPEKRGLWADPAYTARNK